MENVDRISELFESLTEYDRKIYSLGVEISKLEGFISDICERDIDRIGLEKSTGLIALKEELAEHRIARDDIARIIEELDTARLGKEIPRTESGSYAVPWDEILKESQRRVEDLLDGVE